MTETETHFGRFELIEEISTGGMGAVYLACTRGPYSFTRYFILKMMREELTRDPRDLKRFAREARVAALFNHRNVVPVFDFGSVRGRYYIAMEYVDGFNLIRFVNELVQQRLLPNFTLAAFIAAELARGLYYLHTLSDTSGSTIGLVHRDVSPENVMISKQGEVKLTDFGLVKFSGAETLTNSGKVRGKLAYMAPERVIGKQALAASDQFSLGIVLHELLVGSRYFSSRLERVEIQRQITEKGIKPPHTINPHIPRQLGDIVERATSMLTVDRYPSLLQMERELRSFIREQDSNFNGEDALVRIVRALQQKKDKRVQNRLPLQEILQDSCRPLHSDRSQKVQLLSSVIQKQRAPWVRKVKRLLSPKKSANEATQPVSRRTRKA